MFSRCRLCFTLSSAEVTTLKVKHENPKILLFQPHILLSIFPDLAALADENLTYIFHDNVLQFHRCVCITSCDSHKNLRRSVT